MRKILVFVLLSFSCSATVAQSFEYTSEVQTVQKDGFYNIMLTPEIISRLRDDLGDIRIYSDKKEEAPYIMRQEIPVASQQLFKEYKIIDKRTIKNCCTNLVLENSTKNSINNISLIIKNADVKKKAKLSGSDDQQNWYVIKEKYYLEGLNNQQQTYEMQMLDFPLSNYQFYKLEINDSTSPPLNILNAGFYDTFSENGKYINIEGAKISKKDSSDNNTYIWLNFDFPQLIDKLKISITQPQFYYREVDLRKVHFDKKNRRKYSTIQSFELRSNQEKEITAHLYEKELCLVIFNKDNAPLKVANVEVYQLARYLTAYLNAGEKYELRFGNSKITTPEYDLQYFQDTIPLKAPVVKTVNFSRTSPTEVTKDDVFFKSSLWIWMAIVLIGGLLGYMTWKMVLEMKKQS